jgi:hypothetical protein
VLGLLIVFVVAGLFFGAGYATRAAVSRKRYTEYLKYEPYLGAPRTGPPAFLIRGNTLSASAPPDNSDDRSSRGLASTKEPL